MTYEYSYLILGLLFLLVWFALFFWRKDTRKEMIFLSILFGFSGLFVESIYAQDWWLPKTITGTIPGIESVLFGFAIGGISAVIYEELFKKKVKIRKANKKRQTKRNLSAFLYVLSFIILFFGSFYIFKVNSLYASIIGLGIPTLVVYFIRKDLILDSIFSGILLIAVSFIVYTVVEFLTPGWLMDIWYFKNVHLVILFNVPIADVFWYFLAGAYIGPLYEFWQEGRLVSIR